MASHFLAADGHFVGAAGEADRWHRLVRSVVEAGVDEISLLGDFLELWIGLDGLEEPWHRAMFAPLFELRRRGVRLRYLVGNKDYFVTQWNRRYGLFDEVHAAGWVVDSPQGRLYLAHGDLVNQRDRPYRLWRWASRSWPNALVMQMMPRWALTALSQRVARGLKSTNQYHKSYFPEDELRARARELPAGPATLIYGHFHQYLDLTEGDKRIMTLPFLGAEYAGILVDQQGIRLFPDRH